MALMIYNDGTVTTNGTATVTGSGTAWQAAIVTGGMFSCQGFSIPIKTVNSDTSITLDYAFPGTNGAGQTYSIARETSAAVSVVWTNDRLAELLTRLSEAGALGGDPGIMFAWDPGTTDADPGAGKIRANGPLSSATFLYVSKTNAFGDDVGSTLLGLDDSSSAVKGGVNILDSYEKTQFLANISGAVTNATNYVKVPIATNSGATTLTSGNPVSFQFTRAGDPGGAVNSVNGASGTVTLEMKDIPPGARQDIASAGTTNLSASPAFKYRITGTTTITAITLGNNKLAHVIFGGSLTLTHNGTTLNLPTAANIVTQAGDQMWITTDGSGNVTVMNYERASGKSLLPERELLTANRTYYVLSTGNDSNTGLVNNAGGAFLTAQKAIDVVLNTLDLGGFDVTIQLGDATRTASMAVYGPWTGKGEVTVQGNSGTPGNVITNTSGTCVIAQNGARLTIKDMELRSTSNGAIEATGFSRVAFSNVRFGACTNGRHIAASNYGLVQAAGNYAITGGAQRHLVSENGGGINISGRTVTLTGTPAFSQYFAVAERAWMEAQGNTFTGSATGVRYYALSNGSIHTNGGGATYLPGSTNGSTATGGQYT